MARHLEEGGPGLEHPARPPTAGVPPSCAGSPGSTSRRAAGTRATLPRIQTRLSQRKADGVPRHTTKRSPVRTSRLQHQRVELTSPTARAAAQKPEPPAILPPPSLSAGCRLGNVLPGEADQPGPPPTSLPSEPRAAGLESRVTRPQPPRPSSTESRGQTRGPRQHQGRGHGRGRTPEGAAVTLFGFPPAGSPSAATRPTPDRSPRPPLARGALLRKERGHGRRTAQARRKKRPAGSGSKHADTVRPAPRAPRGGWPGPSASPARGSASRESLRKLFLRQETYFWHSSGVRFAKFKNTVPSYLTVKRNLIL